jgi:hypothetical protein
MANDPIVKIQSLDLRTLRVPIIGTSPLIVHKFSEKAKKQMLDAQQGRKNIKQHKDPEADYLASFYKTKDGRYGFPVIAFKAATVSAARFFGKSVTSFRPKRASSLPSLRVSRTCGRTLYASEWAGPTFVIVPNSPSGRQPLTFHTSLPFSTKSPF